MITINKTWDNKGTKEHMYLRKFGIKPEHSRLFDIRSRKENWQNSDQFPTFLDLVLEQHTQPAELNRNGRVSTSFPRFCFRFEVSVIKLGDVLLQLCHEAE